MCIAISSKHNEQTPAQNYNRRDHRTNDIQNESNTFCPSSWVEWRLEVDAAQLLWSLVADCNPSLSKKTERLQPLKKKGAWCICCRKLSAKHGDQRRWACNKRLLKAFSSSRGLAALSPLNRWPFRRLIWAAALSPVVGQPVRCWSMQLIIWMELIYG